MNRNSTDEMERIRRGLEAYLNEEEEIQMISTARETKQRSTGGSSGHSATRQRTTAGKSAVSRNRKKKKKKKRKSGLKRLFLVLLLLVAVAVGIWYYAVGHFYGKINFAGSSTGGDIVGNQVGGSSNQGGADGAVTDSTANSEPMKEDGVINILLIGNDSREAGTDGRSDAMILMSLSSKSKTVHLTSLLRDMYVEIPGYGGNRLNAAYAYGGPELLMETLEENLDIHVNRYVLVNFQAFANVVDAVGGVDLELTAKEIEYVNGYLVEYNMLEGRPEGTDYLKQTEGGMIHLNGPQALAYCRNRLIGTDFGRTERQRKVIMAIIDKAPSALLTNFTELVDSILPNLTTNLTEKECRSLTLKVPSALNYDIIQGSVPIEGSYRNVTIRGMSVLEVDFEANKEYLQKSLYEKKTEP